MLNSWMMILVGGRTKSTDQVPSVIRCTATGPTTSQAGNVDSKSDHEPTVDEVSNKLIRATNLADVLHYNVE
jgi:hypothetical protein